MKRREALSHIMTDHVMTVTPQDDLKEVVDLINKKKIRHVPVVENGHVVGMISRTDINRLTFSSLFEGQEGADEAVLTMLSISQVMTHKPRVIQETQTIREVAEIFADEEFHALPVVNEEGKITGIVTTTDLIKYMLSQY